MDDGEARLRHDDGPRCQATEPPSDDIYKLSTARVHRPARGISHSLVDLNNSLFTLLLIIYRYHARFARRRGQEECSRLEWPLPESCPPVTAAP